MQEPSPFPSLAGCAIALSVAWVLGAALRGMRLRRAWILAGVLTGVALGPQGLGRIAPEAHAELFHGAADARQESRRAVRTLEVMRETALMNRAVADEGDLARLQAEVVAAEERLRSRREAFDLPAVWSVSILATLVMVGFSPLTGRSRWWSGGAAAVGIWSAAAAGAGLTAAVAWRADGDAESWWLCAAAIACVGATPAPPRERWVVDRLAGSMAPAALHAGAVSGVVALALAATAAFSGTGDAAAWLMPWGGMLASWGLVDGGAGGARRVARVAMAAAVAVALTRVDVAAAWQGAFPLWVLVAIEDLRWLGGAAGMALWTRLGWSRSLRSCLPLADASPAIAALAAVATITGTIPDWAGMSLIMAAAAVALMEPLRRGTAAHLDRSIQGG